MKHDGNRLSDTGDFEELRDELEDLYFRVTTLGHTEELTPTTLKAIIARMSDDNMDKLHRYCEMGDDL